MVAARHLQRGVTTDVCYLDSGKRSGSCEHQLAALKRCRVTLHPFQCRDDLVKIHSLFEHADVIIDALLGIGATGSVTEPLSTCIAMANASRAQIIAADIPTPGMRADRICAFHRAKIEGSRSLISGFPLKRNAVLARGTSPCSPHGGKRRTRVTGGKCWSSVADRTRVHPTLQGWVHCGPGRISSGSLRRSLSQSLI